MARCTMRRMSRAEVDLMIDWARVEGWNPGLHDAGPFHAADPEGFLIGLLNGEPIGTISVVRYPGLYGFLGLFIVRPDLRGRGYGRVVWESGMRHLAGHSVGLDGVVAQQERYRREGFSLVHRNIRFGGPPPAGTPATPLVDARTVSFELVMALDLKLFPAPRPGFLSTWISAPGTTALAVLRDGTLTGFGVVRPCHEGSKIGPLYAEDRSTARDLVLGLAAAAGEGPLFWDVPEVNAAAVALAEELGLTPRFETARMHLGPVRPTDTAQVYGICTFELG